MSADFERFIAGEGRLAGVLRAQPGFEPPVGMEARLFAALDALDTEETIAGFEPPAQLEAAVMAEAERLDAAQRPRRDALIAAAARGDDPAIDELGPAAQRWLRAQASTPPDRPNASRRVWRWPLLARTGGAVAAMLALGVALQLWFDPQASRVAQESDAEMAAAVAPASPAPPPAADAAPSPPAEAGPQREASRAGFSRERSETLRRAPATAAMEDRKDSVDRIAAPMAKVESTPLAAELAPTRTRPQASREVPQPVAKLAEGEAPRSPSAVGASAPPARLAGSAPAGDGATPVANAIAPEPQSTPQGRAESGVDQDAISFTLPLTSSTSDFVAQIVAHLPQRWQVSVAPADRPAAKTLIEAAAHALAETGRSDRFVLVEESRASGTLAVESQP